MRGIVVVGGRPEKKKGEKKNYRGAILSFFDTRHKRGSHENYLSHYSKPMKRILGKRAPGDRGRGDRRSAY